METINQNKVTISEEASNTIGCITGILEDLIAELKKDPHDAVSSVGLYRDRLRNYNISERVEDVYKKYISIALKTAIDACDNAITILTSAGF